MLFLRLWPIVRAEEEAARAKVLLEILPDGAEKEKLELMEDGLEYLKNLDAPIHVVPIIGIYRSGKSMLLNHVLGASCFSAGGGDQTITRGIWMCSEPMEKGGTIVWLDTEGLFSSEAGASKLGPRISTLALLTSSAVMLNTMNIYDERWVNFFDEQQKMASILKERLSGVPEHAKNLMMPKKLPLFWVLSRPQDPTANHDKSLERFLKSKLIRLAAAAGAAGEGKQWEDLIKHMAHVLDAAVCTTEAEEESDDTEAEGEAGNDE